LTRTVAFLYGYIPEGFELDAALELLLFDGHDEHGGRRLGERHGHCCSEHHHGFGGMRSLRGGALEREQEQGGRRSG